MLIYTKRNTNVYPHYTIEQYMTRRHHWVSVNKIYGKSEPDYTVLKAAKRSW